jgi:hypothetical protein
MPTWIAQSFREEINALRDTLAAVPPALANVPWRAGGWNRKQIVGHLLDSAANNRQRFVRAALDGSYTGPSYAQEGWVDAHGYSDLPWTTLVHWWNVEHDILLAVVERIPEPRMSAPCTVGADAPSTLQFLIEDYVRHQQWHFRQLQATAPAP